jgi:hypothetical protein
VKALTNVLRVVLVGAPTEFDGMTDLEPRLEEKDASRPGQSDGDGNIAFETHYSYDETKLRGPALKREKDGRYFVYIGWYGTKDGVRTRFRRLKVHLEQVPCLVWDCEVTVAGAGRDGSPACATATVLRARNVEEYLPKVDG